jgi:hypothetical protein
VTEAEWLSGNDPGQMLDFLSGRPGAAYQGPGGIRPAKPSDRKLWLFVAAVERLWWGDQANTRGLKSCVLLEVIADGRAHPDSLERVSFSYTMPRQAYECAVECVRIHNSKGDPARWAALLRDVIGNPFRPVELRHLGNALCRRCNGAGTRPDVYPPAPCPACSCITPAALSVARRAYDERDFGALPVLADALEEAGCMEEVLLWHLRGPDPHVRGCWTLDLVLGLI